MDNDKFKKYIINSIALLKEQARKAKKDVDNPKEGFVDYNIGARMGYYSIFTLLKHQAFDLCIDQKELGLADLKPDVDLLDFNTNPDVELEEDNWSIDVMNEEKIIRYLNDSIKFLKEQALEVKKELEHPEEGYEDYKKGELMAYYSTFSLLKHQASVFNIDENELGLGDVDLEK